MGKIFPTIIGPQDQHHIHKTFRCVTCSCGTAELRVPRPHSQLLPDPFQHYDTWQLVSPNSESEPKYRSLVPVSICPCQIRRKKHLCVYVEIKCQLDATDDFYCRSYCLLNMFRGTIMPIIRSSRVLYRWLLPVVFGALVFKLLPANRTHNPQLHTIPTT